MSDLIDRQDAIMAVKAGALSAATLYGRTDEGSTALYETVRAIKAIPSTQPDNRLERIADIVEGTIDHLDRDDAMDMLYQIKEVLK